MLNFVSSYLSRYREWLSWALVSVLITLPIWVGPFFPTQDGPVYLYNAWVFHSLQDTTNVLMRASFTHNNALYAFPNWCLALLMTWLPPLLAEKWFYTGIAFGWITSFGILCRVCGVKHWLVPFLSALWVFNEMMMLGMMNFCLAQIFWMLATATWLHYRSKLLRLSPLPVTLFSFLSIVSLLIHPFMALPLGVLLFMALLERFVQLGINNNHSESVSIPTPLARWLPWLTHSGISIAWLTLWVCVLLMIVSLYQGSSHEVMDVMPSSWNERWHYWFGGHPLGYFAESHMTLGLLVMWVFMLVALVRAIQDGLLLWHTRESQPWRLRFNSMLINPLTLISATGIILIVIGFCMPWSINNVGFMYKRCFWLAWVLLLPVILQTLIRMYQAIPVKPLRVIFLLFLLSLPVTYITSLTGQCLQLEAELGRVLEITRTLPAHRHIDVITLDKYTSTRLGALNLVSPFYHVDSYVGMQRPDRVTADRFGHGRYNLVWLNTPHIDDRTLDAIVLFRQPYRDKVHLSSAFYEPLFTGFDTRLFLKKPNSYRTDSTARIIQALKNRQPVILGCSDQSILHPSDVMYLVRQFPPLRGALLASLTSDTFERDSGWGWLASSLGVMADNRMSSGVKAHRLHTAVKYPYTQWGRDAAHIQLPLPSGRYRVVWWMYTSQPIPVRMTLRANGQAVARHLTFKPGALNTVSYRVSVGNDGLLQSIMGEGGSPWGMSGVAIWPD